MTKKREIYKHGCPVEISKILRNLLEAANDTSAAPNWHVWSPPHESWSNHYNNFHCRNHYYISYLVSHSEGEKTINKYPIYFLLNKSKPKFSPLTHKSGAKQRAQIFSCKSQIQAMVQLPNLGKVAVKSEREDYFDQDLGFNSKKPKIECPFPQVRIRDLYCFSVCLRACFLWLGFFRC